MNYGWYAFLVFLSGCSYGVLSTIVKTAYAAGFQVADASGSQAFFGMGLLWLVAWRYKPAYISFRRTLVFIAAGIPIGLTSIFYYHSLETLKASLAIIFLFQFVWIGTVMEWMIFRRVPSRKKLLSIVILLVGSALASGFEWSTFTFTTGILWGCAAAVSYTLVILLSGTVGLEIPPVYKSALMSIGAAAVIFLALPPVFLVDGDRFLSILPYGIWLGLFGIALPPLLFAVGIPHVGPGLGSILGSSELPVAVLLSYFVLKEPIDSWQWVGIILILIGILVGNISPESIKSWLSKKK